MPQWYLPVPRLQFARPPDFFLHKLLPAVGIVDIMRFNKDHMLAEHWDVVQRLPGPDYDPMARSSENLTRFKALFA